MAAVCLRRLKAALLAARNVTAQIHADLLCHQRQM